MSTIMKKKSSTEKYPKPRSSKMKTTSGASLLSQASRKQLQKLADEEERELVVYYVREELLNRTMDEIQKRYMEKQCVKFLVHCTYRALCQMVTQYFYLHHRGVGYYMDHPLWSPDLEPGSSPADSWAAHNVPVAVKAPTPPLIDEEIEGGKSGSLAVSEFRASEQQLLVSAEPTEAELPKILEEILEMVFETATTHKSSRISVSPLEGSGDFVDDPGASAPGEEADPSVESLFTRTLKARQESLLPLLEFGTAEVKPSFPVAKSQPMPSLPWRGKSSSGSSLTTLHAHTLRAIAKFTPDPLKEKPSPLDPKDAKKKK